jgi:hypothetical protein
MNTQQFVQRLWLYLVFIVVASATLSCSEEQAGPRAWIDFPRDGAAVPVGTPVSVLSHAYARDGIAEVLLSVNGEDYRRNPPPQPDASFIQITQDWFPQKEGEYILQVKTFAKNGETSLPASVRVRAFPSVTVTPISPISVTPLKPPVAPLITPSITPTLVPGGLSDLAIVNVDVVVVGNKGDIALCKPRVVYRNLGTVPVPNDYVLQLYVNGVAQTTITRGAGFGVGGLSEALFDYTFEGSPYIGVNLDSTNAVSESNETNNAFAEIRMCGGAPVITPTFTPTPSRTPTTLVPPPPVGCSGMPNISSFTVSPSTIQQGQSATLSWGAVTNADSVSIDPGIGGVASPGSRSVSPSATTTYVLSAHCGGNVDIRKVTLNVTAERTRTFTPTTKPADTQGPPAPGIVAPSGSLSCRTSVTLDWNAVSDPSGIKDYIVKWTRNDGQTGGTVTSGTQTTISVSCGRSYTWSVQAEDNAGNRGATSNGSFSIQQGLY